MTNEYYVMKAKCRTAEKRERARVAHVIKRKARRIASRVYAVLCLAGLALVAPVAVWELGKIIEWTWIFIKGLIELI